MFLKMPVGLDNFEKLRRESFYYVDKTLLIRDLLKNWGEVNLFTRPRRFGKTLNMSMLKSFFDVGTDESLFDGLAIAQEKELCEKYRGKYPVVFVSLKDVGGSTFETACRRLCGVIREEACRLRYLKDDGQEDSDEMKRFRRILNEEETQEDISSSFRVFCKLLEKHYGKKVILLIDEYDVPLDKARQNGYYDQMVDLMRSILSSALKTNGSLYFSVLTGCLRLSKESIFTGLNNLKVRSVSDREFDEYFGFTDAEVRAMLTYYGFEGHLSDVKEWYDGYQFGRQEIYCPWDVICYASDLYGDPTAEPKNYWTNTSGNDLLRTLIDACDDVSVQADTEELINGGAIAKRLNEQLTYGEIGKSTDDIWSLLYMTGYLTVAEKPSNGVYMLRLPNREIRQIFREQVLEWFRDKTKGMKESLPAFYRAFETGDTASVTDFINEQLLETVSFFDAQESFYHGFLLALLNSCKDWYVSSNREMGKGRSDIVVITRDRKRGYVVEVKNVKDEDELDGAAQAALKQIADRQYTYPLTRYRIREIRQYGIAFWNKECRVLTKAN